MKVILLISVLAILFAPLVLSLKSKSIEERQLFEKFKIDFKKEYSSDEEEQKHFLQFSHNLKEIEKLNENSLGTKYGITRLSDLHPSQLPFRMDPRTFEEGKIVPKQRNKVAERQPPSPFDWCSSGKCVPIQTMGDSCPNGAYAFTSTALVASLKAIEDEADATLLSAQQILDCTTQNSGCDTGNVWTALVQTNDYMSETSYPYTGSTGSTCNFDDTYVIAQTDYGYPNGFQFDSFADAATELGNGPISVTLDILGCVSALTNYNGGIFTCTNCDRPMVYSWDLVQLLLVGIGHDDETETNYYILQAPYGTDWGESGYLWLNADYDCALGKSDWLGFSTCFRPDLEKA